MKNKKEETMENITFNKDINWNTIEQLRSQYNYCVIYRDHYRDNGKGECFAKGVEIEDFWKHNIERPVEKVILTNDDVPAIVASRLELIKNIQKLEFEKSRIYIPYRPACDGRATERTQPEAFAEWKKKKHKAQVKINEKAAEIERLRNKLNNMPYYSSTLYIKKKPQYPKTYEECCKVLGVNSDNFLSIRNLYQDDGDEETTNYEKDLLDKFNCLWELIICRDAYWKITGEEMGLNGPWEPDWTKADERKYCIVMTEGNIAKWVQKTTNITLAFPTKEMRDVFYENFNDLIEQCKELL